ncbi:MAG: hypothetical protein OQL28_09780 [Sedimenticola sp.]|nr:hypothetical protein [Sedimenticola sp.]
MELEPDLYRLGNFNPKNTERSGVWWVTVIAIGVLVGNILSYGAHELYQRWQLAEFMVTVDAMLEKQHQRSVAQQKQISKDNLARQRAAERERSVNAQFQKTCIFWSQQVQQENTETNRNYRDIACARVNGLFR